MSVAADCQVSATRDGHAVVSVPSSGPRRRQDAAVRGSPTPNASGTALEKAANGMNAQGNQVQSEALTTGIELRPGQ